MTLALSLFLLPAQGGRATAQTPVSRSSAQAAAERESGPPLNPGIFPLSQVRRGMTGTAWTVFEGTTPEPMQVEILGILRGARGPGQDLILARLHGAKPEYTGVVEGMSGSPVYIDGKLAGSLSYRIGQFAKEPIAGITPIEQMLEVRDLPAPKGSAGEMRAAVSAREMGTSGLELPRKPADGGGTMAQPMETPLVMSGFRPEAIHFWQEQMAGTSLGPVAAGGSLAGMASSGPPAPESMPAAATLEPGSAVSMQLIRGDLEVAATCTVTYIDPKQLLACGHPVLGAGPVSMPMTTAEVVTTLASPLEAFKIINTGATVGAFTEDRESAIRGSLGAEAHMIPVHIALDAPGKTRKINVEILDLPQLTPLAAQVVLYDALLQTNESTAEESYHVTGDIDVSGFEAVPVDVWAPSGGSMPAAMQAALLAGSQFTRLYSNGARQGAVRAIDLHVQTVPQPVQVALDSARLVTADIVHAGDTIEVEATVRPWHGAERNIRIPVRLPARLVEGNLRLLVSDAATLDRTLRQPRLTAGQPADLAAVLAEARNQHPADRIYVSLLAPETQAQIGGQTLTALPLSMANALEPMRDQQNAGLNGESAELAGEAPAGGVLSGFEVLSLHIDPGGGLN